MKDAGLVDRSYETQAQAKAQRTTYMAERACSAHETEKKVMRAIQRRGGEFRRRGGGYRQKDGLDNMEAEAHANGLLAAEAATQPTPQDMELASALPRLALGGQVGESGASDSSSEPGARGPDADWAASEGLDQQEEQSVLTSSR